MKRKNPGLIVAMVALVPGGTAEAQAPSAGDQAQLAVLGGPTAGGASGMFSSLELMEPGSSVGTWPVTASDRVLVSGASNRTKGSVHFVLRNDTHLGLMSYETAAPRQFDVDARVALGTRLTKGSKAWTISATDIAVGFGVFDSTFALVLADRASVAVVRPNGRGGLKLMDVIAINPDQLPEELPVEIAVAAQADPRGAMISISGTNGTDFVRWDGSALVMTTVKTADVLDGAVLPAFSASFTALAGDVTADGFDDIVLGSVSDGPPRTSLAVVSVDQGKVHLLTADALQVPVATTAAAGTPLAVGDLLMAVGKLTPNTPLDLVTRNTATGRLRVFEIDFAVPKGNLVQRFAAARNTALSGHLYAGAAEEFLGAVDLNGDGREELLLRNAESVVAVQLSEILVGKLGYAPHAPVAHDVMGCCMGSSMLTLRGAEDIVPYSSGKRSLVLVTRTPRTPAMPPPRTFAEAELWNRAQVKNVVRFDRATKGAYAKRNGQLDAARVAGWQAAHGLHATGRADDATCDAAEGKTTPGATGGR